MFVREKELRLMNHVRSLFLLACTIAALVLVSLFAGQYLGNMPTASATTRLHTPSLNQSSALLLAEDTTQPAQTGADLVLSKVASDTVQPGDALNYVLVVTNSGTLSATNVVLTDTLPTGVTFDSASESCTEPQGQGQGPESRQVICSLGTLSATEVVTLTIDVTVDNNTTGTITNDATVSSDVDDPNPDDNTAQAATSTGGEGQADLVLTKTSQNKVDSGSPLLYTLVIENQGPDTATGVVLEDTLPDGVTFSTAPSTCQAPGTETGGVVTCELDDILAGQLVTTSIVVDVLTTTRGRMFNTAEVTSDNDPNTGNNSDSANTTVGAGGQSASDLVISVFDTPDPVQAGARLTYTLGVLNLGPTQASNIVVSNTLPLSVSLVDTTVTAQDADPGSCDASEDTVICFLTAQLGAGESLTVEILVDVDPTASGTLLNWASVTAAGSDPQLENNLESEFTFVGTGSITETADLALTKSADPDPVQAGSLLSYTLTVENTGPFSATGVIIRDTLPPDVTYIEATPAFTGSCALSDADIAQNAVVCVMDEPLPPNTSTSVVLSVGVDAAASGLLINQAEVTSSVPDVQPGNNSAIETTRIGAIATGVTADLVLSKQASANQAQPGDTLVYTVIVQNDGPDSATGIVVEDSLPQGVAFNNATVSQGRHTLVGNTVVWFLNDPLASAGSATIEINVRVTPDAAGTLLNEASVSGDADDTQLANNTASARTIVDQVSLYLPLIAR
jgi:uncharacterized repeat protein (TIGR01451 family)